MASDAGGRTSPTATVARPSPVKPVRPTPDVVARSAPEPVKPVETYERLKLIAETLASEIEIVKLERKIEGQVRTQVHKNQKEFYLNEQLKAIRKELGHQNEFATEIDELSAAMKKARMPREVMVKAMRELDRLSKMSFMSPEATVSYNFV